MIVNSVRPDETPPSRRCRAIDDPGRSMLQTRFIDDDDKSSVDNYTHYFIFTTSIRAYVRRPLFVHRYMRYTCTRSNKDNPTHLVKGCERLLDRESYSAGCTRCCAERRVLVKNVSQIDPRSFLFARVHETCFQCLTL